MNGRRQWHPTPVLLPGKSHGWRSLVGCSPWGREESDTTERLHFHFSRIGEGNGNPLQCSCLENPRDGRAWWAAVYGVAQSRTRLKRLSSSSSSKLKDNYFTVLCWFLKNIDMNQSHVYLYLLLLEPPSQSFLPSPSPSHRSRLSQNPWLSSLSQTANSCWLSILHMVM